MGVENQVRKAKQVWQCRILQAHDVALAESSAAGVGVVKDLNIDLDWLNLAVQISTAQCSDVSTGYFANNNLRITPAELGAIWQTDGHTSIISQKD